MHRYIVAAQEREALIAGEDYVTDSLVTAVVGLYKLNPVETHSLKAPGFSP
jgi:hypothetical protein